jgi:hypothetical protein
MPELLKGKGKGKNGAAQEQICSIFQMREQEKACVVLALYRNRTQPVHQAGTNTCCSSKPG